METDNSWFVDGEMPMENPIEDSNAHSSHMHIRTEETQLQESCETEVDTQNKINSASVTLLSSTGTQNTSKEEEYTSEECINMPSTSTDNQKHTELDDSHKPSTSGDVCKEEGDAIMSYSCEIGDVKEEGVPRLISSTEPQQEPGNLSTGTGDRSAHGMATETPDCRNSCDFQVTEVCETRARETSDSVQEHVPGRETQFTESDSEPMPGFSDPSMPSHCIDSHLEFSEPAANKSTLESASGFSGLSEKQNFSESISQFSSPAKEKGSATNEASSIKNSQETIFNQSCENFDHMQTSSTEPNLQIQVSHQMWEDVPCTDTIKGVQISAGIKNLDVAMTGDVEFCTDNKNSAVDSELQNSDFGVHRNMLLNGANNVSSIAYGGNGDSLNEVAMENKIESTSGMSGAPEAPGSTIPVSHNFRDEATHNQNEEEKYCNQESEREEVMNDYEMSEVNYCKYTKEAEDERLLNEHEEESFSPQAVEEQIVNTMTVMNESNCIENDTDQRNNLSEDFRGIENSESDQNTGAGPKEVVKIVEEEDVKTFEASEPMNDAWACQLGDVKDVEASELNVNAAVDEETNLEMSELNENAEVLEMKNLEVSEFDENVQADEEKNLEVSEFDENVQADEKMNLEMSELNEDAEAVEMKNFEVSEFDENVQADEEKNLEVSESDKNVQAGEEKNPEVSEWNENENAKADLEKNLEEFNENDESNEEKNLEVSELNENAEADKKKNLALSELNESAGADEGKNLELSEFSENDESNEENNLEVSVDDEKDPEASEFNEYSGVDNEDNEENDVSDEEELNESGVLDDPKDIEVSELHENGGTDPEDDLKEFELSDFEEDAEQDDIKDVEPAEFITNAGANLIDNLEDDVASEEQTPRKRGRKPGKKVGCREGIEHDPETPEPQPRKRGRKAGTKIVRKDEEDVCFVCYDGGDLILCDKRSCPKAYHVECTGRGSDFFERKGQWFCGWHVCIQCSRSASVHCYTCPHALCNTCLKTSGFHFIKKKRGLCADCYAIVNMIEHNEKHNADGVKVDFNDKNTLEGLFNDYWKETRQKHSLTLADLDKPNKPLQNEEVVETGLIGNAESVGDGGSTDSDDKPPTTRQLRLIKRKRQEKGYDAEEASGGSEFEEEDDQEPENIRKKGRLKAPEFDGWASKELMDLIQHKKEDPKKPLSLFEVKKILWQYIDENKLTNPRRRGQIVCDDTLLNIFGKKRVGRFEMMKLISLHVNPNIRSGTTRSSELFSGENNTAEANANVDIWSGKKKARRKSDDKRIRPDPWEYAAINVKNINLIYLKRSVLDEIRNDPDLENKVVGAFVRIRIPNMTNKNDTCYRLVQVVGIKQIYDALDPEKVTAVILEILNLGKREEVTADLVSNQDFVEDECRRLRQSVRCGFIKAMTVGELEERAKALREVKFKDWFDAEVLKFSHLRDRASEKGRKKELRECVEKLKLLNKPEEKERHLNEPFDIDADPQMDPNFESDEEDLADDDNQDVSGDQNFWETKSSTRYFDRSPGVGSAEKLRTSWGNNDSARLQQNQLRSSGWTPKPSGYRDNYRQTVDTSPGLGYSSSDIANDRNPYMGQGKVDWGNDTAGRERSSNLPGSSARKEVRWASNMVGRSDDKSGRRRDENFNIPSVAGIRQQETYGEQAIETGSKHSFSSGHSLGFIPDKPGNNVTAAPVDSEKEKIWCYQDPTKTVQGPFTMEQLRKWEKTNLFPLDLRVWRVNESQDESILLTDALVGRFTKKVPVASSTQMPQIPRGPQQGLQVNNSPSVPSIGLSNTFSVSSTPAGSVNGYPMNPAQGNTGNGFSLGQVHSYPSISTQGSAVQVLPSGPVQVSPAVQGYPSSTQGPQYQGFPAVSQQTPNVQTFVPGPPTQAPHVNGFPTMGGQVPYSTVPVGMQGPIHTPNVNTFTGISVQGASVTGFPQNATPVPNTMVGHPQGAGFNNPSIQSMPAIRSQGPQANTFQMVSHGPSVNMPHVGRGTNNPIRDFRDGAVTPGQVPNQAQDNVWGGRQHISNNDGVHRNQNFGSWGGQGRGESGRDAANQRQFGNGPKVWGNDHYHGNDNRYPAKKDSLCRYFVRGMCKKVQPVILGMSNNHGNV